MFSFFLIDYFNTNDFTRQVFNLHISRNVTVDKVFAFNNNKVKIINKNYINYDNQIVIHYKNNNYCNKFYYKKQLVTQTKCCRPVDFTIEVSRRLDRSSLN